MSYAAPHAVVVGAGIMGSGIAMVFAAEGWRVTVVDPAREARDTLHERMASSMGRLGLSCQLHYETPASGR